MPGTLYITATPIGNLEDITPRAARVLREAGLIAAEDTRRARVLLDHLGVRTKTVAYHKFNEAKQTETLLSALRAGKSIALISDAGTPGVSDPGARLVARAAEEGLTVTPVCGASALTAALSVSGFDAPFTFLGFLPRVRKRACESLAGCAGAAVFYESPLRIVRAMEWIAAAFPLARVCLCNDLTKLHERIYRGAPDEVLQALQENPAVLKGEYVCVIALPGLPKPEAAFAPEPALSLEARLADAMAAQGLSLKEAVAAVHETQRGSFAKKEIYAASLRLKRMLEG